MKQFKINKIKIVILIICLIILSITTILVVGGKSIFLKNDIIRIGAANVTIVSKDSDEIFYLEGFGPGIKSEGVHDPITARALLIDDGRNKVVFVAADLAFSFALPGPIVKEISQKTGIPEENIFLSAIHSHAAPSLNSIKLNKQAFSAIEHSIVTANWNLQPAHGHFTQGYVKTKTYNRRNPERKPDGAFAMMQFFDDNEKCIATLINFGCHPVELGGDNHQISADYVYFLRKRIEDEYGGTTLFFNRHAGDINPHKGYNWEAGDFDSADIFGTSLAEDIIAAGKPADPAVIKINVAHSKKGEGFDTAIINLGTAQIITIPGESLSTFGKDIDGIIPGPYKFFFSYTNGHIGYIVPESEWGKCTNSFTYNCYEESRSDKSFAKILIENYKKLAKEIFYSY